MYEISKRFHFSASHVLEGLPEGHPCGRLHGHNYEVEVVLRARSLNEVGFVRDYGELRELKEMIDHYFDHRHLNDVIGFNPTAEHLAYYLYLFCNDRWPETFAVRVSETPSTWATYSEAM